MVYVDRRAGSAELWPHLTALQVPTSLTTLEFGDACILGRGPTGDVLVGIERKTVRDLVSSLTSGRLSGHQVPGLVSSYQHVWLVVEGSWRTDAQGWATMPGFRRKGHTGPVKWESLGLKAQAIEGYLLTLTLRAGIHVQRTDRIQDTAHWLQHLHQWWTAKAWDEHRAHLALHQPQLVDNRLWLAPNTLQRMAACLPGVGGEKSLAVARHFKSPLEMSLADSKTWQQIPGIGPTIAARVTRILQQGD
jgi:ERCC4-type nuclease